MPEKFFLINPKVEYLDKSTIAEIHQRQAQQNDTIWELREQQAEKAMQKKCTLKHVFGRVVVMINEESKNYHTFSNGARIRRERKFNNFNLREVNPSNAIVVSAENIPTGAEILVDYTTIHDSYRIFDYDSGSSDIHYYSIREEECYAWRMGKEEWKPITGFEFGLRVYKPYEGLIIGMPPTILKDVLYVTTGDLKGNIVRTLKAVDYQIVYQNDKGQEGGLIRFRHSTDENYDREEIVGIAHDLTEQLNEGKLLVGLTANEAKTIL